METLEQLFNGLETVFTPEKVRTDLFEYFETSEGEVIEICSYNGDEEARHLFSKDDPIAISAIRLLRRYDGLTFLPYLVEAIIGNFKIGGDTGIAHYEKFRAELLYNSDFTVVTADYYHGM